MERHRSARLCWGMILRDKKGESPRSPRASISPLHHLPHPSGSSWEPERYISAADGQGRLGCTVGQEKGRQRLQLMKSSAELHLTVIYYLGKQGCDARQITGPTGGQDARKARPGGWEDDDEEEEPPGATAARNSRACWGDLSQLALREPAAWPLGVGGL